MYSIECQLRPQSFQVFLQASKKRKDLNIRNRRCESKSSNQPCGVPCSNILTILRESSGLCLASLFLAIHSFMFKAYGIHPMILTQDILPAPWDRDHKETLPSRSHIYLLLCCWTGKRSIYQTKVVLRSGTHPRKQQFVEIRQSEKGNSGIDLYPGRSPTVYINLPII